MVNEFNIKPVEKDLIYLKIADSIYNYIKNNSINPGDRIPSERVLATQFNTGRNSVREALRILENQGIIEIKVGKGAFVSNASSSYSLYINLIKVNYAELLEIRLFLERHVFNLAIKNITQQHLEEMEVHMANMEAAASQGIYSTEDDRKFHGVLLKACKNKTLSQLINKMADSLDDYSNIVTNRSKVFLETIPHHREILNGFKNKDLDYINKAYQKIEELDMIALNSISNGQQV